MKIERDPAFSFRASTLVLAVAIVICFASASHAETIIYVDDSAPPGGDGTTWNSAFDDLQLAIDSANQAVDPPAVIRMGQGTYTPTELTDINDPKSATFLLPGTVTIEGGYAGFGAIDPDLHDPASFETVLSGDLNGDDVLADFPDGPTLAENANVLLTGPAEHGFTLIGLTITGAGRGLFAYLDESNPNIIIHKCIFVRAHNGGGATFPQVPPFRPNIRFSDCDFLDNVSTDEGGGAIFSRNGIALIDRCRFFGNRAVGQGGAIFLGFNFGSISNCVFSGNYASGLGGAIFVVYRNFGSYINLTVYGNACEGQGGGMFAGSALTFPVFRNCIFWGNTATAGASTAAMNLYRNCDTHAPLELQFNCIEGLDEIDSICQSIGNIATNPQFVDPDGEDDIIGTIDDDFRLLPNSPCIDAGSNAIVISPSNLEQWPIADFDLDGHPRLQDLPNVVDSGEGTAPIVDMGAYEVAASPFLIGDLNCDGMVNLLDIAQFSQALTDTVAYQNAYPACCTCHADINEDGEVNGNDISDYVSLLLAN